MGNLLLLQPFTVFPPTSACCPFHLLTSPSSALENQTFKTLCTVHYVFSLTQFLFSVDSGTINIFLFFWGSSFSPNPFLPAPCNPISDIFEKLLLHI